MLDSSHQRSHSWNAAPLATPQALSALLDAVSVKSQQRLPAGGLQLLTGECRPTEPSEESALNSAISRLRDFPGPKHTTNCVSQCAYTTRTGVDTDVPKKVNQDSFIIKSDLQAVPGQYLFAVCDGHGPAGHLVSQLIKAKLGNFLEASLPQDPSSESELRRALQEAIRKTVQAVHEAPIDLKYSGSTLTCVLIRGAWLVTANLGDSRAELGHTRRGWALHELTRDHKPDLPEEESRIRSCGGRVEPIRDALGRPVSVSRVWLAAQNVPGLAMSRSVGDKLAASVGVISEPEFTHYSLQSHDKFLILATDGLWEFVTSHEAVNIVRNAWETTTVDDACDWLVDTAVSRWTRLGSSVDDITVLVIFFR